MMVWIAFSIELVGASLVAWGCLGELRLLFNKNPAALRSDNQLMRGCWRIFRLPVEYITLLFFRLGFIGRRISDAKEHLLEMRYVGMVAIGVSMELSAIPFSISESIKEAKNVAELKKQNLELESLIAPRRLTGDQLKGIAIALAQFDGRSVGIESYSFDVDGQVLALQLENAFATANLKVSRNSFIAGGGGIELGINVRGNDAELVKAIANALRSIGGLESVTENLPAFKYSTILGGGRASGQAVIMVGAKPPAPPAIPTIKRGP